jgi:hypothetical protein
VVGDWPKEAPTTNHQPPTTNHQKSYVTSWKKSYRDSEGR